MCIYIYICNVDCQKMTATGKCDDDDEFKQPKGEDRGLMQHIQACVFPTIGIPKQQPDASSMICSSTAGTTTTKNGPNSGEVAGSPAATDLQDGSSQIL